MKLQGKVVLAFALVACWASHTQAVSRDASLNVRQHEKGRSLSKRSVFQMFDFLPWLKDKFSRSFTDNNSTTEAPTSSSTEAHPSGGLKTDIARMLTLTRQRRTPLARQKRSRARRSLQELRSLQGLLKSGQTGFSDVLKKLDTNLFRNHHHHQTQGATPVLGFSSFFLPVNFQTGQNTVLFLHHNPQLNGTDQKNETNATTVSPAPAQPSGTGAPPVVIVGSAGPGGVLPAGAGGPVAVGPAGSAISAPVVIVVNQQHSNSTASPPVTSATDSTSESVVNVEPRRVTPATAGGEPSTTLTPNATSPTAQTSPHPEGSTAEPTTTSGAATQQPSTTEGSSTVEGSGTSEVTPEHAREDTVYRFLHDDA